MTAAIGEAAVGVTEGEGAGAAASRAAPTSSAPVGTAGESAGRSGTKPRTQRDLKSGSGGERKSDAGGKAGKKNGGRSLIAKNPMYRKPGTPAANWAGRSSARRALVAEFVVCSLILALSPLTDTHKRDTPGQWMKRATAVCALFLVLGLVASGGQRPAKVAAGFGGLVTVVLLLMDRDVLVAVANRFGAPASPGTAGPPDSGSSPTDQATPSNSAGTGGPPDNFGLGTPGDDFWSRIIGGLGPI